MKILKFLKRLLTSSGLHGLLCIVAIWGVFYGYNSSELLLNASIAILSILMFGYGIAGLFQEVELKGKVARLVQVFLSVTVIFSCVYYYLYIGDPSNYNVSEGIQKGKLQNEFNDNLDALAEINTKIYLVGCLRIMPDTLPYATKEAFGGHPHEIKLKDSCEFCIERIPGAQMMPTLYFLTFTYYGETISIQDNENDKLYGTLISTTIMRCQSKQEVFPNILLLEQNLKEKQGRIQAKINRLIKFNANLSYIDFLYFSSITMTTTGYGDIIPNSKQVRLIVILQTFFSVFFIAYALTIVASKK